VYGEFAGGEHVEVGVDRVVVESDDGVYPWGVPGSGRMGVVEGTKPELNAVCASGPEGFSLMVSWRCRQGAHWTLCRRVRSCNWPRVHQSHCHAAFP
jgi:hypothetical protein